MWARFEASALFAFLLSVDKELRSPAEIVLVGGSAIAIIDPTHATTDLDLLPPGSREFDEAVQRLKARGEPVLPFQITTIVDAPEGFEERLQKVSLNLTSLAVFVPERHDLAIMKVARGYEHDLQALEDVHRLQPFELDILVVRFKNTEAIGPRRRFAVSFLDLVARLYGDAQAEALRGLLPATHN
jgi:hypothetical protein